MIDQINFYYFYLVSLANDTKSNGVAVFVEGKHDDADHTGEGDNHHETRQVDEQSQASFGH